MMRELALEPGDEELAARARQGCAASFEELVRRWQAPLVHFLRRGGARANAEDLAQESFLRAYRHLDRFDPRRRFAAWLFTIARRVYLNDRRRRTTSSCGGAALAEVPSRVPPPPELLAAGEQRQRLWELAAEVLSDDEWTALWLHYVEEFPARDVAAVLERSWVGVKTMLFRARRKLMPRLRRSLPESVPQVQVEALPPRKTMALDVEVSHG